MTVLGVTHLDALWDRASLVADGAVTVNPAEAFVSGASILLHDAAMSLGAYPNGLADVRKTVAWQDSAARLSLADEENGGEGFDVTAPPKEIEDRLIADVLQIGRAHVLTPVTNAQLICRLPLENTNKHHSQQK